MNRWYGSEGHKKAMLNEEAKTAAASLYVRGERGFGIQLFNMKNPAVLNALA